MEDLTVAKPVVRDLLLLEDNPALARVVTSVAEAEGFRVYVCVDAPQALKLLESLRPAAAIVDCMLAGGSGLDVLGRLAAHDKTVPILVVSGYGGSLLRLAEDIAQRLGFAKLSVQPKPFAVTELRAFLRESGENEG